MDAIRIGTLVTPAAAAHDLELDRLEVQPAGKRSIVRVFLDGDGPDGRGPSLDQIADATRSISAALDAADITRGRPYTLEVSSRGVGRPLTEAKHFRRNVGRLVALTTTDGDVTGRILGEGDGAVVLDVDGQREEFPLDGISRALVQVELNRSPADGTSDDDETLDDEDGES